MTERTFAAPGWERIDGAMRRLMFRQSVEQAESVTLRASPYAPGGELWALAAGKGRVLVACSPGLEDEARELLEGWGVELEPWDSTIIVEDPSQPPDERRLENLRSWLSR